MARGGELVIDPVVLRTTLLRVMAQGPATWPQVNARAGGNLDIIAAGFVLSGLEQEGLAHVLRGSPTEGRWHPHGQDE